MSSTNAARRKPSPAKRKPSSKVLRRLHDLKKREVDFIPNSEFDASQTDPNQEVLGLLPTTSEFGPATGVLGRFGERDVLSPEDEAALFREMNRLKYVAYSLREKLTEKNVTAAKLNQVSRLLDHAEQIRDYLIESNLRLVLSLAKKFVSSHAPFDDLVSEGAFTLMKAVEKFDYDRGFRFSTYAYRSIARDAYRQVTSSAKAEARTMRHAEEWAFEQEEDLSASPIKEQIWSNLRTRMESMLEKLDRRERFIVRSRYALGAHRKPRSFRDLGDRLGVSKERARQLERRAVEKLQAMAADVDLDELFGAALA